MSTKVKKAEKAALKTPRTKKYQLTIFQIKLAIFIVVTFLSYRYDFPVDSFVDQEITVLLVTSFLLLAKPSPYYKLMKKFSHPKLMFVLVYLAFIVPPLGYANTRYFDWDNAQMIKGLARDFPALVAEIESATGLDLEQKTDCMTTTEKFSSGVKTCELLFYSEATEEEIMAASKAIEHNDRFVRGKEYQNKEGYIYHYRNKENCEFRNTLRIRGSCIIAVRDTNTALAIEEFNKN